MERLRRTLVLLGAIMAPAAAYSSFDAPQPLCFADGSVTYQLSPSAARPDFRIRFDNAAPRPDLRIQTMDGPELADFTLVDDFAAPRSSACRSPASVRTVKVDGATARPDRLTDVIVALGPDVAAPHYRVYVHSVRYSHQDAAAFLAAMWKSAELRERTATARLDR